MRQDSPFAFAKQAHFCAARAGPDFTQNRAARPFTFKANRHLTVGWFPLVRSTVRPNSIRP